MFERFTDPARRVVVLAQEEARLLGHDYIGTEHLLLGLAHDGESVAGKALEALGISLEAARAEVLDLIGAGASSPAPGHIPFTPRAKKVLELSLREALQLGDNYIGTEHILLGLEREGQGVAAHVLAKLAGDLSRVRQQVIQVLSVTPRVRRRPAEPITSVPYHAANLAGRRPIEPEHYLLAVFAYPDSRAGRALGALGVTREAVEAALADLDPPAPEPPAPEPPAAEPQAPEA